MMEEQLAALNELSSKCTSTKSKFDRVNRNLGDLIIELRTILLDKLKWREFDEDDRLEGVRFTELMHALASISKEIFAENKDIAMGKLLSEITTPTVQPPMPEVIDMLRTIQRDSSSFSIDEDTIASTPDSKSPRIARKRFLSFKQTRIKRRVLSTSLISAEDHNSTANFSMSQENASLMENDMNGLNDSKEFDVSDIAIKDEIQEDVEDPEEDLLVFMEHRDGLPLGCTKDDFNSQILNDGINAEVQSNYDDIENDVSVDDFSKSASLSEEDENKVDVVSEDGHGMYDKHILSGSEVRVGRIDPSVLANEDETLINNTFRKYCQSRGCRNCDNSGGKCVQHRRPLQQLNEVNMSVAGAWNINFNVAPRNENYDPFNESTVLM